MNLEDENKLLRSLVADLSALVKDLFEAMPSNMRELPQSQRAIEVSTKLYDRYKEYGTSISTSNNRR
jgi:hypothetical protein